MTHLPSGDASELSTSVPASESDPAIPHGSGLAKWRDATDNGIDFRVPSQFGWWRPRDIEGEEFTFNHLWPFDFRLERPATPKFGELDIRLTVNFDCHVVTEDYDPSLHGHTHADDARMWFDTGAAMRCFQQDRFQRSFSLPEMVKGLATGHTACFKAKKDNLMIWKPEGAGPDAPHYQAFFTLTRPQTSPEKLLLYVQSAYLKDHPSKLQRENRKNFVGECASLMGIV